MSKLFEFMLSTRCQGRRLSLRFSLTLSGSCLKVLGRRTSASGEAGHPLISGYKAVPGVHGWGTLMGRQPSAEFASICPSFWDGLASAPFLVGS